MNLLAKKHAKYYYSLSDSHDEKNWGRFPIPEFMIGQTFSFPHYISTDFIWCYRVCYIAWWTRVLWGHHATLVYIKKMGVLEKLCLRASESRIWQCVHPPSAHHWCSPHQVSHCVRTFNALLRNNLCRFFTRCASSSNFLSDRFKCPMLFTNLHFSSIIQHSCMMAPNCNSCWCSVSVFASHQYCFSVLKNPVFNVHKPGYEKQEMPLCAKVHPHLTFHLLLFLC